jgi:hypothetical protein
VVQLTGLVDPKICDVGAIVVSDVSEKFWKFGSTNSKNCYSQICYLLVPLTAFMVLKFCTYVMIFFSFDISQNS